MTKFVVRDDFELNKTSSFLLTLNTNKPYRDEDALLAAKDKFQEEINKVTNDFENYLEVYEKRGSFNVRLKLSSDEIGSLLKDGSEIRSHLEVGSKHGLLHDHTLIRIVHEPKYAFKLDLGKLRSALPIAHHLNARFIKDPHFDLVRYIRKNISRNKQEQDE